jgi:hypothetical protein
MSDDSDTLRDFLYLIVRQALAADTPQETRKTLASGVAAYETACQLMSIKPGKEEDE